MGPVRNAAFEFAAILVAVTSCFMIAIFCRYIAIETGQHGFMRMRFRAAIAICTLGLGLLISRGWIGWAVWADRHGIANARDFIGGYVPVIALGIKIAGILCIVRVFAPDDWGDKAWLFCAAASVLITAMIEWDIVLSVF